MTLVRLGILPWRIRGRRTSISIPFTPITTTRGFGFAPPGACANRSDGVRSNDAASVLKTLTIIGRTPKCGIGLSGQLLPSSYLRAYRRVATSVLLADGEAPVFAGRFTVHRCSADQKTIFRATWTLRPSLALVIFPSVGG